MRIHISIPGDPAGPEAARWVRQVAGQVHEGWDHGAVALEPGGERAVWDIIPEDEGEASHGA